MRDQKVQKKKKRIFGAVILFLMMALALTTTVLAAKGQWVESGSYSLVIQKQFDKDIPEEVLKEAKKQTYRFHIEGYRLDAKGNEIPIDETVTIGPDSLNWTEDVGDGIEWKKTYPFCSDGPIHVSVTEITNDVTLEVGGEEYNMGDSRAETTTLFAESPQERLLNSNGKITLSRPAKKIVYENGTEKEVDVTTTSSFRIYSEWPWDDGLKPAEWKKYYKEVELVPGGAAFSETNLPAGRYIIEDMSVSGYRIQLGSRSEDVAEGGEGTFYINSKPGKLKITAGGKAGDGGVHYYRVERISAPEGAEVFVDRYTDGVASGASYTLENLPRGEYKVKEYESTTSPKFQVCVAETKEETVKKSFYKTNFGTTSAAYTKFSAGGDYITDFKFGPLRNADNNKINSNYSYKFAYRYKSADDGQGKYSQTGVFTCPANGTYSDKNRPIIHPRDDGTLAFAVWNVTAKTGDHVDLSWIEHTRVKDGQLYTELNPDENYTFHVDDRGWIKITAPAAQPDVPGVANIQYTYTLRKEDGSVVRTLTLKPGETVPVEKLEAGKYFLMETVGKTKTAGFRMEISGDPFGSTAAGHSFDLTVMGERQLTIIKPKPEEGKSDGGRTYTFTVERTGGEKLETPFTTETVTLLAGQSYDSIKLPAGQYRVTPTDDMTEIFELTCSDSSQVHAEVPSEHASSVTFTNVFSKGNMGYRYVHEYYLRNKDGKYTYEGNSPITTVGGRSEENETYTSIDITKEQDHTTSDGQTYTYVYMPEKNAYGYVDLPTNEKILELADNVLLDSENGEVRESEENGTSEQEEGEASEPEENETLEPGDGKEPEPEENKDSESGENGALEPEENEGSEPEGKEELQLAENATSEPAGDAVLRSEKNEVLQPGENETLQPEENEDPKVEENEILEPGGNETPQPEENEDPKEGENEDPDPEGNETLKPGEDEDPEPEENEVLQSAKNMAFMSESNIALQAEGDEDKESNGLWLRNQGLGGDGTSISYHVDETLTQNKKIGVDEEKSQIIILRYYRVLPEDQEGTYNYVHVYYRREPTGEVWEGTSTVTPVTGQLGAPYSAMNVMQEPDYKPKGATTAYHYTYNERPSYGTLTDEHTAPHIELSPDNTAQDHKHYNPNSDANHILATKEGKEIIILRYYRDVVGPTEQNGAYKVVHEYYYREELENQDTEDVSGDAGSGDVSENNPDVQSEGRIAPQAEDEGEATDTPSFSGTLSSDSQYAYTFEGAREVVTLSAPLGSSHRDTEVTKLGNWRPGNSQTQYSYAYKDAVYGNTDEGGRYNYVSNMEWASSTEDGAETIILRYVRGDGVEVPEIPKEPDPPGGGGGGGGGHDPDPTPPPVEEEIPEIPPEELPTELPDPNDPDSPDRITILEDGVPRTYVKVWDPDKLEWVYIPEEEVPLWGMVPQTGDGNSPGFLLVLAAVSLCGLGALKFTPQKKDF